MKICIAILTILFFMLSINGQAQYTEEYRNYDYFSHSYKYLNKDYKIKIPSNKFRALIKEHRFIPNAIENYKDSLAVVMYGEFDNWAQANIAVQRIGFTWLRAGYYLWLDKKEAKELGQEFGFEHPYLLYKYMYDNTKWSEDKEEFISVFISLEKYTSISVQKYTIFRYHVNNLFWF